VTPTDFDAYRPPADPESAPRAVYVHVPFCFHRCGYCDFTLVADRDDLIPAWLAGMRQELSRLDRVYSVDTLFVGGGTPTHLSCDQLQKLFELIFSKFELANGAEVSIEANPDGLDSNRLNTLAEVGVNRLSLGVQSFDGDVLKTLERQHDRSEAIEVVHRAAEYFGNVSLDLIFGVPGMSLETWLESLAIAKSLPLQHVSTYGLTFEKGTDFFSRMKSGGLVAMPDELERDMYAAAMRDLAEAGFRHYEISNFAKPGHECRHNQVYWAAEEYFAFGPGAARYVNGIRSTNARSVVRWVNHWNQGRPVFQEVEQLSREEKMREAVFLGLRLNDGISLDAFQQRYGRSLNSIEPAALEQHLSAGLLEIADGSLRLTQEGRFLADTVVSDFL